MSQPDDRPHNEGPVTPCIKALLEGFIDYAGLFPPARLPINEALTRYLAHRGSARGWMLARFVCPVARLDELELMLSGLEPAAPIAVAALGRGGGTLDSFNAAVGHDAAALGAFLARSGQQAAVEVFEVALPEAGGAAVAVERAWQRMTGSVGTNLTLFFEISLLGAWRPRMPAAAAAVRDTARAVGARHRIGLKIRCGGLEAAAVPEPAAVAAAIATARAVGVPLKATQGLHHPFRHHDPELGATAHGFLNLFVASVLAHVHDLPVAHLTEVVAEADPEAFVLTGSRIGWRDLTADADEVSIARERLLIGFGSCSFSEPCDDLRSLRLID
jgi:hypothetical protein